MNTELIEYNRNKARELDTLIHLYNVSINGASHINHQLVSKIEGAISNFLDNDLGSLLLVNLKSIPTSKEWTVEKWMECLRQYKILLVDEQVQ